MYLHYFSLRAKPFELLPDPDFLYLSAVHRRALAYLEYGLQELPGFILVTGEVGAGKTTLLRTMLRKHRSHIVIAKIFNTKVNAAQLVRMILDDFGVEGSFSDKSEMLHQLNMFLIEQYAAGRHAVLIIDEAQNLEPDLLEEVRLLSNLETDNAKLLHIILVGQPELRRKLGLAELSQLRQRILVHCHLPPLGKEESEAYILHRLEQAGNRDALAWHEGCMAIIHAATRGVPRLINILCDYILLDAFSASRREVTPDNVNTLLEHLDFSAQFWPVQDELPQEVSPASHTDASLVARLDVLYAAVSGLIQRLERIEESVAPSANSDGVSQRLAVLEQRVQGLVGVQHKLLRQLSQLTTIKGPNEN